MEERAEEREHLLFNEIAIVRAETDHTRDEVSSNRKELIRLWKRLNTLQQRVGFGKTSPHPED